MGHNINNRSFAQQQRLIADFTDKSNFICHWKYLAVALKYGLQVTSVKDIIEFRQEAFAREYIDICKSARAESKSDFEKMVYKNAQNGNFGKFLENMVSNRFCQ